MPGIASAPAVVMRRYGAMRWLRKKFAGADHCARARIFLTQSDSATAPTWSSSNHIPQRQTRTPRLSRAPYRPCHLHGRPCGLENMAPSGNQRTMKRSIYAALAGWRFDRAGIAVAPSLSAHKADRLLPDVILACAYSLKPIWRTDAGAVAPLRRLLRRRCGPSPTAAECSEQTRAGARAFLSPSKSLLWCGSLLHRSMSS
jgi:hypothetical protein